MWPKSENMRGTTSAEILPDCHGTILHSQSKEKLWQTWATISSSSGILCIIRSTQKWRTRRCLNFKIKRAHTLMTIYSRISTNESRCWHHKRRTISLIWSKDRLNSKIMERLWEERGRECPTRQTATWKHWIKSLWRPRRKKIVIQMKVRKWHLWEWWRAEKEWGARDSCSRKEESRFDSTKIISRWFKKWCKLRNNKTKRPNSNS